MCLAALLIQAAASGCAASRRSTTPRTAVEEALVTSAIDDAVAALDLPAGEGRLFYVDRTAVEPAMPRVVVYSAEGEPAGDPVSKLTGDASYRKYLLSSLEARFLAAGYRAASREQAELIIYPRIEYCSIDDSDGLIGLPSIPLPLPGAGTVETPEVALFGLYQQRGRASLALYAVDRQNGKSAFQARSSPGQRTYSRWTLLIFFSFRTTDLADPF